MNIGLLSNQELQELYYLLSEKPKKPLDDSDMTLEKKEEIIEEKQQVLKKTK